MLSGLRYFTMLGTNQITDMSYMFQYCYLLCCIPAWNTSNVTKAQNMFKSCSSLTGIPEIDISQVSVWLD